ncbi:MAG: cytochrome c3 family protein [Deltaproteobacteria bacterium]|nr:cytochrome c3 family protein [Deltaproteobacteria bacterium]
MARCKKVIGVFVLWLFGFSILWSLPESGSNAAASRSFVNDAVILSQKPPEEGVQTVKGEPLESASLRKDFKQRHARHGIRCGDCHESDPSLKPPTMAACLQCHGSYKDVAALTEGLHPNPHDSHMGEVKCRLCHKEHKESELFCNRCHVFEMKVP